MLRNYLTIALRNLRQHKAYAAINVGGLAIGLAVCFLIALFVRDELSYDDFHANADRFYRVAQHFEMSERSSKGLHQPAPLALALERTAPAVEKAVRGRWACAKPSGCSGGSSHGSFWASRRCRSSTSSPG